MEERTGVDEEEAGGVEEHAVDEDVRVGFLNELTVRVARW